MLQRDGFVKRDTFICKIFARFVVYLCAVFALQLRQLLLVCKKPRRKQEGPGIFSHPWSLCVPADAEKPGRCGSGCRQYFHEIGVVLGSL